MHPPYSLGFNISIVLWTPFCIPASLPLFSIMSLRERKRVSSPPTNEQNPPAPTPHQIVAGGTWSGKLPREIFLEHCNKQVSSHLSSERKAPFDMVAQYLGLGDSLVRRCLEPKGQPLRQLRAHRPQKPPQRRTPGGLVPSPCSPRLGSAAHLPRGTKSVCHLCAAPRA